MNIHNLETQYLKAKVAYYEGNPLMPDSAFDVLEQQLKKLGSKVIEQVGSKQKDFDFPHPTPMKSLSKIQTESISGITHYQEKTFMDWLNKRNSTLLKINKSVNHIFYAPKFDGSAINIIYRQNNLESVLTRGDGKSGKDITNKLRKYLPPYLNLLRIIPKTAIIEIRCEAVISTKIFEEKYAKDFANARNFVAGVLGKDDVDEEKVGDLTLVPLHYIIDGKHVNMQELDFIIQGYKIFSPSFSTRISADLDYYVAAIKSMEKFRKEVDFQLDGVVFSFPSEVREYLGENDHDPEWAIAIKFVPDEVITTVVGIDWSLGKSGELTPVVLLKPVQLAGTTVKRASGYNAGYVLSNKIGRGSLVSIIKAGDIIPEIQAIHTEGEIQKMPNYCVECNSKLEFDGIHLMCNNENCVGIIAKKLAAGAAVIDLKGIGGRTLEPFAKDFENIYELFRWAKTNARYGNIDKYGIKYGSRSHEIFVEAFENIQSLSYDQVILMMSYDGVGKKLAQQVAKEYCGLVPNYTSMEKALVEKLRQKDIVSYITGAVRSLESFGVTVDRPSESKNEKTIYICMTGSPKNFGFKTKEEFIKQFPNVIETSLTDPNCTYLITDSYTSSSSKMKLADKKGVKIVTYGDFKPN